MKPHLSFEARVELALNDEILQAALQKAAVTIIGIRQLRSGASGTLLNGCGAAGFFKFEYSRIRGAGKGHFRAVII